MMFAARDKRIFVRFANNKIQHEYKRTIKQNANNRLTKDNRFFLFFTFSPTPSSHTTRYKYEQRQGRFSRNFQRLTFNGSEIPNPIYAISTWKNIFSTKNANYGVRRYEENKKSLEKICIQRKKKGLYTFVRNAQPNGFETLDIISMNNK